MQLSAEVSGPPCQDERDEDSLSVLPSDDVESQACGASVDQNSTRVPRKEEERRRGGDKGQTALRQNSLGLTHK